jgi:hypothetical protein
MAVAMFLSIPKEEVRIPLPALISILLLMATLGGALWGISFYLISRNRVLRSNGK